MVSQRVEIPKLDNPGTSFVKESKTELRGAPATTIEWMILAYVAGLIWIEIKQLWDEGAEEYVHDMWNILDFVTNSLYIATLTLRVIAYLQVKKELEMGAIESAKLPRKDWDPYDPNLIAEALFATANIFSCLKLVYIFTANPHLGPLQISLGRMIMDILKFAVLYLLVLFSFACGLNHLHWYYAALRAEQCAAQTEGHIEGFYAGHNTYTAKDPCDRQYKSFANLFEIIQSLYWAIYGLVDLEHAELEEPHEFTEFIGKLMFGSYSWIGFVVLLNLLIAMMSNSYQNISSQADEEWKFARSKLWISYFDESGTLPAPFNIIPSPKTFYYIIRWCKNQICACSKHQKRSRWQSIRKVVKKINEREIRYQAVMRDLIKRYIMAKQRSPQRGEGVTEDDINELKQDISSFRYELLEILRNNGMKTPNLNQAKPSNRRLSRRRNQRRSLERLKKSFTMTNITELVTQLDQNTTDFDGGHRPASVTESCTGAIPETIMEENEAQRKLSKDMASVTSKEHEVSVETEPLMTISNDISDTTSPSYLPSYNSIHKYENQSNVEISDYLLGDSPIPIPTLEREPASRYGSQPREQKFDFSEKGLEMEPMTRQIAEQNEADVLKNTTAIGNSKVKPNNPAFDAAIGFLLETKKDKRPVVIKRVKFNN